MREGAPAELPKTPEDAAAEVACAEIARDISALKPSYAQLFAFDEKNIIAGRGECSIDYAYRTHPSTHRGGWVAQVPNPDPDGVWFHIAIWDPEGPARLAQINTQPGFSVFARGDRNMTVLILDGASDGALDSELRRLLRRHGLGKLLR